MSIIERAIDRLTEGNMELTKKPMTESGRSEQFEVEQLTGEQLSINSHKHVKILNKLKESGMITTNSGRSLISEEFRRIKRHVLMNVAGRGEKRVDNSNVIMVTSSLPNEGKTFSAINLAMSFAMEQNKTVLLVDADVANPSVTRDLGIENFDAGLVEFLTGEVPMLSDLILNTDVPNLRILPAGRTHQHATELFSSTKMDDLIDELAKRFPDRIVVFDSPPLLVTTESAVLSEKMSQILMVVEAEKTPQSAIKDALSLLDSSKIIGLILNKSNIKSKGSNYGYGPYSYGYDYAKQN
ncbi:MAG: XrtA-associated tyrosine autokinase [Gammaproteobacteria bacterium]|nr:XrtA-associated tyrosine autokinase [Gammaproteobacteria bacterium]